MAGMGTLIGTPSRSTIRDNQDNIIVKEGEIITQGVLSAARRAGRLDILIRSAGISGSEPFKIEPVPEFIEIGEEDPTGVHPE